MSVESDERFETLFDALASAEIAGAIGKHRYAAAREALTSVRDEMREVSDNQALWQDKTLALDAELAETRKERDHGLKREAALTRDLAEAGEERDGLLRLVQALEARGTICLDCEMNPGLCDTHETAFFDITKRLQRTASNQEGFCPHCKAQAAGIGSHCGNCHRPLAASNQEGA